jgi:carboxypeptidase T
MSRACWLALGLLACAGEPDQVVHAEAWVGPGSRGASELPGLLAGRPVSVEGPDPSGRVRVIASHRALDELRALGLEVQLSRWDHRRPPAPGYHSADRMADALRELAEAWPDRAELVDLGRSVRDRPLLALRIGSGPWRVRLMGAHHGDELSSAELTLAVAERLLEDPPEAEVWVLPHVNPDGVADGSRYNARSVDLNRNYGYKWSESEYRSGEAAFSEPETRAVRVLSSYRGFASGLSMHAGAALICYVWNYSLEDTPDEQRLASWSEDYRRRCGVDGFYIINGGAWYITYGDTTDWSYGRQGTLDYTLEVSVEKTPPADEIEGLIDDHMDAVLEFVARQPDLLGTVIDAEDGSPIEASLVVSGGWDSVAGPDGRFARWLGPGPVQLEVQAPGYASELVELELQPGVPQQVELALERQDLIELRPEPALISWGDQAQELLLPGVDDEWITLWRPGYPSVSVQRDGDGYPVVPSELAPGPWGLTVGQGSAPRALLVGARDDRVELRQVDWREGALELAGQGFEPGTRAWAMAGLARNLVPLTVLEQDSERLLIDAEAMEGLEGTLDLLVVSSGAQLAALDLAAGATVDTGAPQDTHEPDTAVPPGDSYPPAPGGGRCGCWTSRGHRLAPALFLVTLASLVRLRRRQRNPCRPRVSS